MTPDIERLREAVGWLDDYAWHLRRVDGITLAPLEDVGAAVLFLVSLADQGGELWAFESAPPSAHPCECEFCGHWHAFPEGSRVRVWPKVPTPTN